MANSHSSKLCNIILIHANNRSLPASLNLLVIAKEDLDWKPAVTADLESVWKRVELLHLLRSELPSIKLKVVLDSGCGDTLWDDTSTTLKTPHEAVTIVSYLNGICRGLIDTYRTCAVDLPLESAIFLSVWSLARGELVEPKHEYAVQ